MDKEQQKEYLLQNQALRKNLSNFQVIYIIRKFD